MAKKCINPPGLFNARQYGFSQIVVSGAQKQIFISGQVSCDEQLNVIGANNLEAQVDQSLQNLKTAMQAADATMDDVVLLRIYIVNYSGENSALISDALLRYFGTDNPPAATWISVAGLANPEFMIEIEAQAAV